MHRFCVPELRPDSGVVEFTGPQSRQLARVLRMAPGDRVEVFDGAGLVGTAVLTEVNSTHTAATLAGSHLELWPFPWRGVIYLAMIRPSRFEWAIEKAAELGALRIVPVITARTARSTGTLSDSRLARWRQIAVEAAEQCGSAFITDVTAPLGFTEALGQPAERRLLAWESLENSGTLPDPGQAVHDLLARPARTAPVVALFFGPEGGFEDSEIEAAVAAGCKLVTLGPRLLRAETAAVAALAMLVAATGRQPAAEHATGIA